MAVRSTVSQITNLGIETTPGTGVAATKQVLSVELSPEIKGTSNFYRPLGNKYPTVSAQTKEWTEAKIKGVPTYTEMIYLLAGMLVYAAPAANGANGAYDWTFAPSSTAVNTVKTYTIEQGSTTNRAGKFVGAFVDSLNIKFDREKVELDGSMVGQLYTDSITPTAPVNDIKNIHASAVITGGTFTIGDGTNTTPSITGATATFTQVQTALNTATPNPILYTAAGGNLGVGPTDIVCTANTPGAKPDWTITPTSITGGTITRVQGTVGSGPAPLPLVPIVPNQQDLFLDLTTAGLGGTRLASVLSGEIDLGDYYNQEWTVDSTKPSWANQVEKAPKAMVKLMFEANAEGMAILTDWRANTTKFLRYQATGPICDGGSVNYKVKADFAVKPLQPQPFADKDGVWAIGWDFEIVHDANWGKAMNIVVTNALSAL